MAWPRPGLNVLTRMIAAEGRSGGQGELDVTGGWVATRMGGAGPRS